MAVDVQGGLERSAELMFSISGFDTAISKNIFPDLHFYYIRVVMHTEVSLHHCHCLCTGGVDFEISPVTPFLVSQPQYELFLNASEGSFSDATELLVDGGIPSEEFFQSLPILSQFYFCWVVEVFNDDVIESTEEFAVNFASGNENDGTANVLASIADNDGMLKCVYLSISTSLAIIFEVFCAAPSSLLPCRWCCELLPQWCECI